MIFYINSIFIGIFGLGIIYSVYISISIYIYYCRLGIGDWGLGIGDWAQSPIPNPQSPIPKLNLNLI